MTFNVVGPGWLVGILFSSMVIAGVPYALFAVVGLGVLWKRPLSDYVWCAVRAPLVFAPFFILWLREPRARCRPWSVGRRGGYGVQLLSDRADRLRIRGYIPRRITICLWSESVKRLRLTRGSSGPQSVPSCRTGGKSCYEEAARRPLSRRVVRPHDAFHQRSCARS